MAGTSFPSRIPVSERRELEGVTGGFRMGEQGTGPGIPPHKEEGRSAGRAPGKASPSDLVGAQSPAPPPTFVIFPGKPPGGGPLPGFSSFGFSLEEQRR